MEIIKDFVSPVPIELEGIKPGTVFFFPDTEVFYVRGRDDGDGGIECWNLRDHRRADFTSDDHVIPCETTLTIRPIEK